ncbi:MAG TPA: site-specific integrase [Syntrophales bacterium]|nr:site-specific integrase [Syntrophales bacterium]
MPVQWKKTNFPGVRYYEHPTRKNGIQRDRYFAIRYQAKGQRKEEGLGWATEDWTLEKAALELARLKEAARKGDGPVRLSEARELAERERQEAEAERERKAREAVTFGEYFNRVYKPQAEADKKPESYKREDQLFTLWIEPVIGGVALSEIAPFHLERLKKSMTDAGRSPRSIEYALAVVRQVFRSAQRNGLFQGESPTTKVKWPKTDNARMRYLSAEEAHRLLEALKEKSVDVHDITLLGLHCGLRFGEIAALTWADVDMGKGLLTIRDAKAGSRFARLTETAKEMLKNRPRKNGTDLIFQGRGGQRMKKISHTFWRVLDNLGLNDGCQDQKLRLSFHSTRHTFGTLLYEQTQDLYVVQKMMGHATSTMTARYAKMTENRLKEATEAIEKALEPKKSAEVVNFGNTQ